MCRGKDMSKTITCKKCGYTDNHFGNVVCSRDNCRSKL